MIEIPFVPKCERASLCEGIPCTQKEICEGCKIYNSCQKDQKRLLVRNKNLKSLRLK